MTTTQIPQDWDERGTITFEAFVDLIRTPNPTVRGWRQRADGPRWARVDGCGRLCNTFVEAPRFFSSVARTEREGRVNG